MGKACAEYGGQRLQGRQRQTTVTAHCAPMVLSARPCRMRATVEDARVHLAGHWPGDPQASRQARQRQPGDLARSRDDGVVTRGRRTDPRRLAIVPAPVRLRAALTVRRLDPPRATIAGQTVRAPSRASQHAGRSKRKRGHGAQRELPSTGGLSHDAVKCRPRLFAETGIQSPSPVRRVGTQGDVLPPRPADHPLGNVSWLPPQSETPREQDDSRPHARGGAARTFSDRRVWRWQWSGGWLPGNGNLSTS